MSLSKEVLKAAFDKASGKCECRNEKHEHRKRRCSRNLFWENRGKGPNGVWEARVKGRGAGIGDIEVLCWKCFKQPDKK